MRPATEEEIAEVVRVINERGYYVVWSSVPREIGDHGSSWLRRHDMVVFSQRYTFVSETDELDAIAQAELLSKPRLKRDGGHYYRVTFD